MTGQPIAYGNAFLVREADFMFDNGAYAPSVAALADGTFIVVWQFGQYWNYQVEQRVFNADGSAAGDMQYANSSDGFPQITPVVTALSVPGDASVDYVIAYTNTAATVSPFYEIKVAGTTGPFTANEATDRYEFSPSATLLDSGDYVIAWISSTATDPFAYTIVGEIFTPGDGAVGGGNITLSPSLVDDFRPTRMTVSAVEGGFVLVAQYEVNDTDSVDGSGTAIVWRMFDNTGAETEAGGVLNTNTDLDQYDPAVVGLVGGGFVAVWTDNAGDENGSCVKMRIYTPGEDPDPGTLSGEIVVNTTTIGNQERGMVTALADGGFIVAFESYSDDGEFLILQAFDATGAKVGGEVTVTDALSGEEVRSIATLADGRVVVTFAQDAGANLSSIFGRIFDPRTEAITFGGTDLKDNWVGTIFNDTLSGGLEGDRLRGNTGNDFVAGGEGDDVLFGDKGNDRIRGDAGMDRLVGGKGRDILVGGDDLDKDTFVFLALADMGKTPATRDIIKDFTHLTDVIDLSAIDANGKAAGDPDFKFLAKAGAAFTGVKGQLHWYKMNLPGTANDRTVIEGDINGDRKADFHIALTGLKVLTIDDFVL